MTRDESRNGLDQMAQMVVTGKTSMVLNPVPAPTQERTYVTFGVERGGTSLVAGVLRALGLYLGDIPEGNNEDRNFHNKPLGQMRATINERNAEHDVWGWKYPTAVNYLPVLSRSLRNPHFIIVFRDTVATALSRAQWDGEFIRRSGRMSLHETNANANANMGFALATRRPCMLISNEKAQSSPSALIDELADFLFVDRPDDDLRRRILAYTEPGRYKKFDDYFPADNPAETEPAAETDSPEETDSAEQNAPDAEESMEQVSRQ